MLREMKSGEQRRVPIGELEAEIARLGAARTARGTREHGAPVSDAYLWESSGRANVGEAVRLAGWVHRKRDHGKLVFVDLRDHYGLTQCVIDAASPVFAQVEALRPETVVTVSGDVVARAPDAINPRLRPARSSSWCAS